MSIVGGNSSPTGPIMKEIKLLLMKLSFSSIGLMIFLESLTSGDRTIESCPLSDGHGYLPQDGGPAHFTWNPAWSAQNRIVVKRKSGFGKFPLEQLADTESAHHST